MMTIRTGCCSCGAQFLEWQLRDHSALDDVCKIQDVGDVTAADSEADREFELSSPDGGRTWLPVTKHGQAEVNSFLEARALSRHVEGFVGLALVLPTTVSMFPLTPAVRPLAKYLSGGEAQDLLEQQNKIATDGDGLQPLVGVFQAQPFRSGGDHGHTPEYFQGVIVISRAVPRPSKVCGSVDALKSVQPCDALCIAIKLRYFKPRTDCMSAPEYTYCVY